MSILVILLMKPLAHVFQCLHADVKKTSFQGKRREKVGENEGIGEAEENGMAPTEAENNTLKIFSLPQILHR